MTFDLHSEALCWLRYSKQMPIVLTEGPRWNSDVIGLNSSMWIEVEVKKSIADLRAEFKNKGHKHFMYKATLERGETSGSEPNYFYFLTEAEIYEKALPIINEHAPYAGLVIRTMHTNSEFRAGRHMSVLKNPKRLHKGEPKAHFVDKCLMRMSSELCGQRLALNNSPEGLQAVEDALAGMEGTLDANDSLRSLEDQGRQLAFVMEGVDAEAWPRLSDERRLRWIGKAHNLYHLRRRSIVRSNGI